MVGKTISRYQPSYIYEKRIERTKNQLRTISMGGERGLDRVMPGQ